jgi:ribosome-interacting GTPase 1
VYKHPNPILKKYAFNFFQVPQTELDIDTVRTILNEYKINNADVVLRDDSTADDLVDVVEGNRVFLPCIYLLNKIDQISIEVCL